MDDLEVRLRKALGLGEVAREAARDRDLLVRERADRPVAEREDAALAELVEAVLGREPDRDAGERARGLAVGVRVDEVRVEDRRPLLGEVREDVQERARVDVGLHLDPVDGHAARLERAGELPGARLVLVQHQEPDRPAALHERRQQLEQVRLRAGDAGDLLDVEDDHAVSLMGSEEVEVAELEVRPRRDRLPGVERLSEHGEGLCVGM